MKMMYQLFRNINKRWQSIPKDKPVIHIKQANGTHNLSSITNNQLFFHSKVFRFNLPSKQSIVLEDLTLGELVDTINGMGYQATITEDGLEFTERGAFILLARENIPIGNEGGELPAFTSKVWRALYPIAKLLEEVEGDIEVAIQQMYMPSASGKWLEFWASFFNIKRTVGESDSVLLNRIATNIVNPKTNNRSIEELIRNTLNSPVQVWDVEPARFGVEMNAEVIQYGDLTHELVNALKGAGFDYFINYTGRMNENVKSYLADRAGGDYQDMMGMNGHIEMARNRESRFGYKPFRTFFRTNSSKLNSDHIVVDVPERIHEFPDTYGAHFEWNTKAENYDRLQHKGSKAFKLNASKTNKTDRLNAKYHDTARLMGGEVSSYYEDKLRKVELSVGGDSGYNLEEHSYQLRKMADEDFDLNQNRLNGATKLSPFVLRMLEQYVSSVFEAKQYEVYKVDRTPQVTRTFFRTNQGVLNKRAHTLYGVPKYGDIMGRVAHTASAEIFPKAIESVSMRMERNGLVVKIS